MAVGMDVNHEHMKGSGAKQEADIYKMKFRNRPKTYKK
ncbi:hypothetical protein Tco_0943735, partial [Tanacetum coccineum]